MFLVHEVDDPQLALSLGVGIERICTERENRRKIPLDVLPQPRVRDETACNICHGLSDCLEPRLRCSLGEPYPVCPSRGAAADQALCFACEPDIVGRVLFAGSTLFEFGRGGLDRVHKRRVEVVGGGCGKVGEQVLRVALTERGKARVRDIVRPRLVDELLEGIFPALDAQSPGELDDVLYCGAIGDRVDRLSHERAGLRFIQHTLFRGQSGFECEALKKSPAYAIHCACRISTSSLPNPGAACPELSFSWRICVRR